MTTSIFDKSLALIDAANAQDPNIEVDTADGCSHPKELLYGKRMSSCLSEFVPNAPELLHIAVRAQHIERWVIPRSEFPMDRTGYLQWRRKLGQYHAQRCGELMLEAGYRQPEVDRARDLLQKKNLKTDTEAQTLEDVACLVFIKFHLSAFAAQHDESKLIPIIQKTWNKMSNQGQQKALSLQLDPALLETIGKALKTV